MITIIFNENDKIYFKNNENGIINKSSLMKNSLTNNSFIQNNNSGAQESNRNDKILFNITKFKFRLLYIFLYFL